MEERGVETGSGWRRKREGVRGERPRKRKGLEERGVETGSGWKRER